MEDGNKNNPNQTFHKPNSLSQTEPYINPNLHKPNQTLHKPNALSQTKPYMKPNLHKPIQTKPFINPILYHKANHTYKPKSSQTKPNQTLHKPNSLPQSKAYINPNLLKPNQAFQDLNSLPQTKSYINPILLKPNQTLQKPRASLTKPNLTETQFFLKHNKPYINPYTNQTKLFINPILYHKPNQPKPNLI